MGRGVGQGWGCGWVGAGRVVPTPLVAPNHPVIVSILDVSDGHELDVWVIDFVITPRQVGEASVNILHCGDCQHSEKGYQIDLGLTEGNAKDDITSSVLRLGLELPEKA